MATLTFPKPKNEAEAALLRVAELGKKAALVRVARRLAEVAGAPEKHLTAVDRWLKSQALADGEACRNMFEDEWGGINDGQLVASEPLKAGRAALRAAAALEDPVKRRHEVQVAHTYTKDCAAAAVRVVYEHLKRERDASIEWLGPARAISWIASQIEAAAGLSPSLPLGTSGGPAISVGPRAGFGAVS